MFGETFWAAAAVIVVVLAGAVTTLLKLGAILSEMKALRADVDKMLLHDEQHDRVLAGHRAEIDGMKENIDRLFERRGNR